MNFVPIKSFDRTIHSIQHARACDKYAVRILSRSFVFQFLFRSFLRAGLTRVKRPVGRARSCVHVRALRLRICMWFYPASKLAVCGVRRDQFLNEAANGLRHRLRNLNPVHARVHESRFQSRRRDVVEIFRPDALFINNHERAIERG